MSGNNNRNNNNKSAAAKKKSSKESKQAPNSDKESVSTDSLLNFISSASNAMRKALDMTKQGNGSKKRDPNHRRHLIKNMKESSLEYSAYNKRRYKRRSTSCSSVHNGADNLTDSSEYLTDTMRALFMNSADDNIVRREPQNNCDTNISMPPAEQFGRDTVFFQENQWTPDCESIINTSQHYLNASVNLQLSGSYENGLMPMPIATGYIPDSFECSSNLTNSPSYLNSSLDLSESYNSMFASDSIAASNSNSMFCSNSTTSNSSSMFCSISTASNSNSMFYPDGSSCAYTADKATGVPSQNGNMNNNVIDPEALASGEFSRVDARLVEHVLAQSDIQTTMNELVDIARPKRKRVSLTPTHGSLYPYAPCVYPETPAVQPRHSVHPSTRPKSWTATRPAQHHKLVHKRQSCPPPVYPGARSPSCCQGSATGLNVYQGGFFRGYWEPPGSAPIQTEL